MRVQEHIANKDEFPSVIVMLSMVDSAVMMEGRNCSGCQSLQDPFKNYLFYHKSLKVLIVYLHGLRAWGNFYLYHTCKNTKTNLVKLKILFIDYKMFATPNNPLTDL